MSISQDAAAHLDPNRNEIFVAGGLNFEPAALGWVGAWRMRRHGVDYTWKISGVGYDEAFDNLVRGALRVTSGNGTPD